jgi:hypothetical protein
MPRVLRAAIVEDDLLDIRDSVALDKMDAAAGSRSHRRLGGRAACSCATNCGHAEEPLEKHLW